MSMNRMYLIIFVLSLFSTILSASATPVENPTGKRCISSANATIIADANLRVTGGFHFRIFTLKANTLVNFKIQGLVPNNKYAYHIHNDPIQGGRCASAQGHFNPTNSPLAGKCDKMHRDKCESGDLAGKYGLMAANDQGVATNRFVDSSLLIEQGRKGIVGRSVVIHDSDTKRIACGTIKISTSC